VAGFYTNLADRPDNLARVLEIFRVYYNYCKAGKDKKTPAMRLGLARAPVAIEDVLYYQRSGSGGNKATQAPTREVDPTPPEPLEKSSAEKTPLKHDVSEGESIAPD
jgi:hypothetical protein